VDRFLPCDPSFASRGCSVQAKYAMQLDLYQQVIKQDENTGEIVRNWLYVRTIQCLAKSQISSGIRTPANDKDISKTYDAEEIIKIMTGERLSRKYRVSKIRDLDENILWEEADIPGSPPTIFEVVGSTPILDGFGQILEYESTLQRTKIQNAFN
jgi:hypothetical protein